MAVYECLNVAFILFTCILQNCLYVWIINSTAMAQLKHWFYIILHSSVEKALFLLIYMFFIFITYHPFRVTRDPLNSRLFNLGQKISFCLSATVVDKLKKMYPHCELHVEPVCALCILCVDFQWRSVVISAVSLFHKTSQIRCQG